MRSLLIPFAIACLGVTACSSAGGGGPSASTGEIGRRSVPGYEVVVSRDAAGPAGAYRVDLAGARPQQVEAWIACCGYEPDAATIQAEPIAGTAAWRVALPTSGKLWVRITDAGGNVLEVGGDDFPTGH